MFLQRLIVSFFASIFVTAMTAAQAADELAATRSLAKAGAVQLALQRVELLQPAGTASPPKAASPAAGWADWERLRLQLLASRAANDQLLQRVAALPTGVEPALAADFHAAAARSALILGRGGAARDQAARALWTAGMDAGRLRELRLLVIRSLVMDGHADDAYRSMLRFQQDYRPLDAVTATQFVDGLLDLKRVQEAVAWLGLLDERGPAMLRLRLHTGLLSPADVVAQARAGIARSEDPAWWRVLLDAAEKQPAPLLKIEALEQLLDRADTPAADASRLWEAYLAYARSAANTHQLLAGDESSWLAFALKRKEAEPVVAHAYLAFLAREGRGESLRRSAQVQLASALMAARLPRMALQLFDVWPADPAALSAETRYQLGGAAEALQQHVRALQYRQGLPSPDGTAAAVWDLRMAGLALRAGRGDVASVVTRQLAAAGTPIPPAQLPEWLALTAQLSDHGLSAETQLLAARVTPHADAEQARLLLAATARALDSGSQPLLAAEYHLRLAMSAPQPDAVAESRLRAGFNLARGGLRDDARVQFEWVLKNARDPAQIAIARRELGF
ncbi:MAG: hypothetical protein ACO22T_02770 [Burkholderiales bacterium]